MVGECCQEMGTQLTCFASRFTGRAPIHQLITAAGRDPVLLHSTSNGLSADTDFSLVTKCTARGFTSGDTDERRVVVSASGLFGCGQTTHCTRPE